MVTLHHLNNSRSQRILWLMEELSIEYEIKEYQRDAKTSLAPAELKKVHPLGKAPIITDGDIVIAESGAIIEYLVAKYGPTWGATASEDDHQQYLYWLHFSEGSLMPWLVMSLVFDKIQSSPMPFFVKPIARAIAQKVMGSFVRPNLSDAFEFIEKHLANNEWFAGDAISGADCQMSFPLEAARARGVVTDKHVHICAYLDRIKARPAHQRALEKGGEYAYA